MRGKNVFVLLAALLIGLGLLVGSRLRAADQAKAASKRSAEKFSENDRAIGANAQKMMEEGRQTFRFDTFGDEAFWGDALQLHQAIEGANFGGVGAGLSPRAALSLGLKVDVGNLSAAIINQLKNNHVNLNDPAVTLFLLKRNAVVGLNGSFNPNGSLRSVGISCSLCHSTVDNSLTFGIGHRLDGWANRDCWSNCSAVSQFATRS